MEPFIGQITFFAFGGRIPNGWAPCNGQLLPISTNQALFAIIGTTYGGNGTSTFALPNLQGRIPIGAGGAFALGAIGGEEAHTLTTGEIPGHNHSLKGDATGIGAAITFTPSMQTVLGPASTVKENAGIVVYNAALPNGKLASQSLSPVGKLPHENRMPYQVMNAYIALQGLFPSRN